MSSLFRSLGLGMVAAASIAITQSLYEALYLHAPAPFALFDFHIAVGVFGFAIFGLSVTVEALR